jgi:hypothetical protein
MEALLQQAIECLLCEYKVLSSNPSPTKKKKKKKTNTRARGQWYSTFLACGRSCVQSPVKERKKRKQKGKCQRLLSPPPITLYLLGM